MKSSTGKIAPLVCMVAVCVSSSTSAQRRARPAAVRSITPTEYAAKVAGIEDRATFKARASSLPNAAPLLSSMVAGDNEVAFRKGEFAVHRGEKQLFGGHSGLSVCAVDADPQLQCGSSVCRPCVRRCPGSGAADYRPARVLRSRPSDRAAKLGRRPQAMCFLMDGR